MTDERNVERRAPGLRPPTPAEIESWERSQAEPIRKPPPDRPRRRIDEMDADGYVRGAPVELSLDVSYELDPPPAGVDPEAYAALFRELLHAIDETPERELDDRLAWIARRVWIVTSPPKLATSGGPYDAIGVALRLAAEAKRRGIDPRELARPRRRRLLDDDAELGAGGVRYVFSDRPPPRRLP